MPFATSPIRISEGRLLVLSDLHLPFEDTRAVELAAAVADDFKPTHLILNGDVWDAMPVSPFPVPVRERVRLAEQVDAVSRKLRKLIDRLGFADKPVIFIEGNHELWWIRYIQRRAQELEGLPQLTIPSILSLPDNIQYLPHIVGYRSIGQSAAPEVVAGALHIMHGDTVRLGAQLVNVARTICMRMGVPTLVGHWHVCQEYLATTYDGRVQAAWASGALVLPRAAYNSGRIAQQGIATVTVSGKTFECSVIPFWHESSRIACFYAGKRYIK